MWLWWDLFLWWILFLVVVSSVCCGCVTGWLGTATVKCTTGRWLFGDNEMCASWSNFQTDEWDASVFISLMRFASHAARVEVRKRKCEGESVQWCWKWSAGSFVFVAVGLFDFHFIFPFTSLFRLYLVYWNVCIKTLIPNTLLLLLLDFIFYVAGCRSLGLLNYPQLCNQCV